MPIVKVDLWKGCTKEQKAQMAQEITDVLVRVAKKRATSVVIQFQDYETENWAIGGELASDIDWSARK